MTGAGTPVRLTAVVAAVLAVVAVPVVLSWLLLPEEPGRITLNTSSSVPAESGSKALILSVVRIDANGCVYLESPGSVRNIVWPDGYTASLQPNGTVTIANPDGVAVAASGQRLSAAGGVAAPNTHLACQAEGSNSPTLVIQDELPPLND
jgi:hypothetical protein